MEAGSQRSGRSQLWAAWPVGVASCECRLTAAASEAPRRSRRYCCETGLDLRLRGYPHQVSPGRRRTGYCMIAKMNGRHGNSVRIPVVVSIGCRAPEKGVATYSAREHAWQPVPSPVVRPPLPVGPTGHAVFAPWAGKSPIATWSACTWTRSLAHRCSTPPRKSTSPSPSRRASSPSRSSTARWRVAPAVRRVKSWRRWSPRASAPRTYSSVPTSASSLPWPAATRAPGCPCST